MRAYISDVGMMSSTAARAHALGVVERHPVRHARAAVVADDVEAVEAQRLHDRDAVARHRALGVRLVVVGRHGLGRLSP